MMLSQLERELDKDLLREISIMHQLENSPTFVGGLESRNAFQQSINTSSVTSPLSLDPFSPQISKAKQAALKLKPLAEKDSAI